jgi:signal transduction histidine kinase
MGFDQSSIKSNGIGLTNMKNRAEIIGADFVLKVRKIWELRSTLFLKRQP